MLMAYPFPDSCPDSFGRSICANYLRRPPPRLKPPLREPMLEPPRVLLARALEPLYPPDPLEPPPKASRFPPPLRLRSRLPIWFCPRPPDRSPNPPSPALLLTPAPPRLLTPAPPGRLLARLPPCRPSCCLALA